MNLRKRYTSPENASRLSRDVQGNLIQFLQTELDIGLTMLTIARTTENKPHRARLLKNIQSAIDTIRHFETRITDGSVREELLSAAAQLARKMRTQGGAKPRRKIVPTRQRSR